VHVLSVVMVACLLALIPMITSGTVKESEWFNSRSLLVSDSRRDEMIVGLMDNLYTYMQTSYFGTLATPEDTLASFVLSSHPIYAPATRFFLASIKAIPSIVLPDSAFSKFAEAWARFSTASKAVADACSLTMPPSDNTAKVAELQVADKQLRNSFTLMLTDPALPGQLEGLTLPKAEAVASRGKQCTFGATGAVSLVDVPGSEKFKFAYSNCEVRGDKTFVCMQVFNQDDSLGCPGLLAVEMSKVNMTIKKHSNGQVIAIIVVSVAVACLIGGAGYIWYSMRLPATRN